MKSGAELLPHEAKVEHSMVSLPPLQILAGTPSIPLRFLG